MILRIRLSKATRQSVMLLLVIIVSLVLGTLLSPLLKPILAVVAGTFIGYVLWLIIKKRQDKNG